MTNRIVRSITATLTLLLASAMIDTPTAQAGGDNILGGRVVTRTQLYATAGFPDVEFGVHLPFGKFEVTPNFRFAFADSGFGYGGYGFGLGALSAQPGVAARWQLLDKDNWKGSMTFSFPIILSFGSYYGYGSGVGVGIGLFHPGFMVTYGVSDLLDLDFGAELTDDIRIADGAVWFSGGVPVKFGAEFHIAKDIQLAARFEGGPGFSAGAGWGYSGVGVYPIVRGVFAFGYSF